MSLGKLSYSKTIKQCHGYGSAVSY